jgi:hypothetical protein
MCTVSFIPAGDSVFITHNRDEKSGRSKAIAPKEYAINNHRLLFPRDTQAGGTWIAVNAGGAVAVLLNGAFVKHAAAPVWRKSRGLVLLDMVAGDDVAENWRRIDLRGVEPFTVVLWSNGMLCEGRWDGRQKHTTAMDATTAHIWSSVTLYDETVSAHRAQWFAQWQSLHPQPLLEDIMQFHLSGGDGDKHNDLRMNRDGLLLTVSVTAMELTPGNCRMKYLDLQENTVCNHQMSFTPQPVLHL